MLTDKAFRKSTLPNKLDTGIVHLGLGAFHRAHQAVYTEDAIDAHDGPWGIEAVSMRDGHLAKLLNKQNGRFTLIELAPSGPTLREISSIRKSWSLPDEAAAIADRMADPGVHIVGITVTEKGYCADMSSRKLERSNPGIVHDLANPDTPRTLLGILKLGLQKRMQNLGTGLTLMSCDNLPANGHFLRKILLEFTSIDDSALAEWVDDHCTFPCSMVDRITPASTKSTFELTETALGHRDLAAVETEPFSQWVIEDNFAGPRPRWEAAGVLIVDDVEPFELMKLRMLNGSHSLIAYLGTVQNISAVRDVMADPLYAKLVKKHMTTAATTLKSVAGFDLMDYANDLIDRFSNPSIEHLCSQIAMDGSQKLLQRIFSPMQVLLDRGDDFATFTLSIALWIRHIQLSTSPQSAVELSDPLAQQLRDAVADSGDDVGRLVEAIARIVRPSGSNDLWNEEVIRMLVRLNEVGVSKTVADLLD